MALVYVLGVSLLDASNLPLNVPACPSTRDLGEFTSLQDGQTKRGAGDKSGEARPAPTYFLHLTAPLQTCLGFTTVF